jgi:polysaccharide export outer membrane protein
LLVVGGLAMIAGPILGCSSAGGPAGSGSTDAMQLASTGPSAGSSGGGLNVVRDLPAPSNASGGSDQPLASGDVLEVDVFQVDNLDRTVQVDASGRISLPLIGSVTAGGVTLRDLEQEVERAYGAQYLQSPDVTIFVKESAGQRVTVDGEVMKAGIYPVTGTASLLDAVALAGGFQEIADPTKVYVYRDINGQKLVANYNVTEIRQGKRNDPRIYGGDVIVVFQSKSKIAMRNLKDALGVAANASRIAVIP